MPIKKIFIASPRGFCAGVDRAIETVEECLKIFGKPVYVKHQIVHNKHVVENLENKGAITVESIDEIPNNSIAVFSAHGSPPEDYQKAITKGIKIIDATCPLVTRVHIEVQQFTKKGYTIIYIGHKGHQEAIGVLGQTQNNIYLVETINDVKILEIPNTENIIYLTQTTLSINDTKEIIKALKDKYPRIKDPPGSDICYATTNRQNAVKELAKNSELVLIVGSKNSSNSNRLVETAKTEGKKAYLIDSINEIKEEWLNEISTIGISSGASVPEYLLQEIVEYFTKLGAEKQEIKIIEENIIFTKPIALRK